MNTNQFQDMNALVSYIWFCRKWVRFYQITFGLTTFVVRVRWRFVTDEIECSKSSRLARRQALEFASSHSIFNEKVTCDFNSI